jgi:hypothetical protein
MLCEEKWLTGCLQVLSNTYLSFSKARSLSRKLEYLK